MRSIVGWPRINGRHVLLSRSGQWHYVSGALAHASLLLLMPLSSEGMLSQPTRDRVPPAGPPGVMQDPEPSSPAIAPDRLMPSVPSFNSTRLDEQIRQYAVYLAGMGVPDVLVIGSSRALQGIDPDYLQHALATQGYPSLSIYNFSVNGATAQVVNFILQTVLTPDQLPSLIIWADGSRAFNSNRADATYRNILNSAGFAHVNAGGSVIVQDRWVSQAPDVMGISCWNDPLPWRSGARDPRSVWDGPDARNAPSQGARRFFMPFPDRWYPVRDRLEAPSPCVGSHSGLSDPSARRVSRLERQSVSLSELDLPSDIDARGFLAVDTRFDPADYYQRYPRVPGQYDASYVPFRLEGEQTEAAKAIARFAQAHQIDLVFVNLPLSDDYLDAVRRSYEQQFHQHMQTLANQEGFIFRDLNRTDLTKNGYFADPSHLNQFGAQAVSLTLASDAVIPWRALPVNR